MPIQKLQRTQRLLFKFFLVSTVFLFSASFSFSQNADKKSSILIKTDTLQKIEQKHSPKKATLLSALVPGAGQVYNRKYWKVPIIYAAFGGLAYLIKNNNDSYHRYYNSYIARTDNQPKTISDPEFAALTDDQLLIYKNSFQNSRDFDIICAVGLYLLNVVDATVDAHLYTFDVSDNLSMQVHPSFIYTAQNNIPVSGLAINLKF